jgi:V/A-type H+-transporting ATPase subunit I
MQKASIIVHQNYLEDVIKSIHESGLIEIFDISKEGPDIFKDLDKADIHPDAETLSTYYLRLSRLIKILNKIKKKKNGIKAILKPEIIEKKPIEERNIDELLSFAEGELNQIEKDILNQDNKILDFNDKIQIIKNDIDQLNYLYDLDLDISEIGESDLIVVRAGITEDIDELKNELKKIEKSYLKSKQFGTKKKVKWVVVIAAHISEINNIDRICRDKIMEFSFNEKSGKPKELIKKLNTEKKEIEKEKKLIISDLQTTVKDQLDDLLSLREEIQLAMIRKEITCNFGKTQSTYIINGWVLEKDVKQLNNSVISASDDNIICEFKKPSTNPDNPPTYFKTPKWATGFKGLLSMFALPKYNEVNPTIIMGIFFVLFFGFMLGDAGYGLVLLFLSIFGYLKFSKLSEMIRSWSIMGIFLGLVTTVIGLLTNSFFGNFIPMFFYGDGNLPLYQINLFGIDLPANPIKDPLTILTIALIFGLIHLNIGIILGIIQAFKRKNFKEMLTNRFCWIPLQIGGGLLIGYFILDFQLSEILFYIAGVLVIIGIIQLFISSGPIGFFDITGFVGDWLSYARLLALGLATAGMALAFNIVAQLFSELIPIQILGIILMILILFVAHLVNLGLQALGAGVHSLRLQYVEFFNRFYEGGGHEFSPFKLKRKYTKIENDKNE